MTVTRLTIVVSRCPINSATVAIPTPFKIALVANAWRSSYAQRLLRSPSFLHRRCI